MGTKYAFTPLTATGFSLLYCEGTPSMGRMNTMVVVRGFGDTAPHPSAEGVAGPK
jgi:hypothetical protein